jgi:hypothetical protein
MSVPKFRKKPVIVEASQWFKNGDHPDDYAHERVGLDGGELRTWSGQELKANAWQGQVVRYFRRPDVSGTALCRHCSVRMHEHGWIDTKEGGHIVCPGDWIITGMRGERYPCKPDIFAETYEAVGAAPMPVLVELYRPQVPSELLDMVNKPMEAKLCRLCGQPMLPKGVKKKPNEYDHARGCPYARRKKGSR